MLDMRLYLSHLIDMICRVRYQSSLHNYCTASSSSGGRGNGAVKWITRRNHSESRRKKGGGM